MFLTASLGPLPATSHADIWGAVYRDNERDAVHAFVEGMDQSCPGVS